MMDLQLDWLQEAIAKESYVARKDSISRRRQKTLSSPSASWVSTARIGDVSGKALSIVLATIGCTHARGTSGGCTMCSYLLDGTDHPPTDEQLYTQFSNAFSKLDEERGPLSVKIYTSGSFLDSEEVSPVAQDRIIDTLAADDRIVEVVIETRPEFVTDEVCKQLKGKLGNRSIELGIGYESSNENIRNICINKGFTRNDFIRAMHTAHRHDVGIRAYVMLKPPFISERLALDDTLSTIFDCGKMGVNTISVNPVNVQRYTLTEQLWERGEYRPPWLWTLVEVLKRARPSVSPDINIVCDPVASGKSRGVHNCGRCDSEFTKAVRQFSITQSLEAFDPLSCECFSLWEHVMQHEEHSSVVHTDRKSGH